MQGGETRRHDAFGMGENEPTTRRIHSGSGAAAVWRRRRSSPIGVHQLRMASTAVAPYTLIAMQHALQRAKDGWTARRSDGPRGTVVAPVDTALPRRRRDSHIAAHPHAHSHDMTPCTSS